MTTFGVSAIATFQPALAISNDWFEGRLKKKFVKHTGILSRYISFENEVQMGRHAANALVREIGCDWNDCAGLVFVSPSSIPMSVACRFFDRWRAKEEQPTRLASHFADALGLTPRRILGINSFCSGYARGLSIIQNRLVPTLELMENEFVLLVTSSRISRITDFSCELTGALFGDLATISLISRCDSRKYPPRFEVIDAKYKRKEVYRPFFDFSKKKGVLAPTSDGGRQILNESVVFSLDGMGIADTAPRAMTEAAVQMIQSAGLNADDIQCIVPHQAGTGIVHQTKLRLEDTGFRAKVINGLTEKTGNVSSCSVPFSLKQIWDELNGYVLCPVAAVGAPGRCEVSQGCILLRSTDHS